MFLLEELIYFSNMLKSKCKSLNYYKYLTLHRLHKR